MEKINGATVRDDFSTINTVLHYNRTAHFIGLWKSELALLQQYFPDKTARLHGAGTGAGRVAVGLSHEGYHDVIAFDFASELGEQSENVAQAQGIAGITFFQADAIDLSGTQHSVLRSQLLLWPHELNANGMFISVWRKK